MKTPKDILFARHRPAEAKLDAIRREAVAQVGDRHARVTKPPAIPDQRQSGISFLRELFRLKPPVLAGLAAVWILIFTLRFLTHDGAQNVAKQPSVSREAVAELRQQRLFYVELVGLREARDAEPPKTFPPGPRSEGRFESCLV